MSRMKGNMGFIIIVFTFSILIFGLYGFKDYMETHNYSILSTPSVSGCSNCGFSASLGGFFVGLFPIFGIGIAFLLLFGIISIISLALISTGYKLIIEEYGYDTAQGTMNVLTILFMFACTLIIGSFLTGEIKAALDGKI